MDKSGTFFYMFGYCLDIFDISKNISQRNYLYGGQFSYFDKFAVMNKTTTLHCILQLVYSIKWYGADINVRQYNSMLEKYCR